VSRGRAVVHGISWQHRVLGCAAQDLPTAGPVHHLRAHDRSRASQPTLRGAQARDDSEPARRSRRSTEPRSAAESSLGAVPKVHTREKADIDVLSGAAPNDAAELHEGDGIGPTARWERAAQCDMRNVPASFDRRPGHSYGNGSGHWMAWPSASIARSSWSRCCSSSPSCC
jgi:hypothetical protein